VGFLVSTFYTSKYVTICIFLFLIRICIALKYFSWSVGEKWPNICKGNTHYVPVLLHINLNYVKCNKGAELSEWLCMYYTAVSHIKFYLPSSFISMPRPRNEQCPSLGVVSKGIPSIGPLLSKSRPPYVWVNYDVRCIGLVHTFVQFLS
jgi:hypothetical protein